MCRERGRAVSHLPPPDRAGLVRETVRLVGGCIAAIVVLSIVVYFLTT
jgi:hypothetical protein